ncbi:hypothetical protein BGM03_21410 [Vibrio parahaemolyticus]|nr:hypothetical protein BBM32_11695 [Vibrio parahaemolyticus]ODZ03220.1 hypothetical protein BBM98_04100 [Vibrio parahaemolyticus]OWU24908.1 hypothetical protein BGM03_21410 [Vibrio parahaemolyticus]
MWPKPIHPYLLKKHAYRCALAPYRHTLMTLQNYDDLINLDLQVLDTLYQLEHLIVSHLEKMTNHHINSITSGKYLFGLKLIEAAIHRLPSPTFENIELTSRSDNGVRQILAIKVL